MEQIPIIVLVGSAPYYKFRFDYYSTVTDFAKFLGLSTSSPFSFAT